jgi:hypothetical protein
VPDTVYVPKGIKSLAGFFGHLFGLADTSTNTHKADTAISARLADSSRRFDNRYSPALSLTTGYLPYANSATTLSNSPIYTNGSGTVTIAGGALANYPLNITSDAAYGVKITTTTNSLTRYLLQTYYNTTVQAFSIRSDGQIYSSGPIFSDPTSLPNMFLQSPGAYLGTIQNAGTNAWGLGYVIGSTTLGTCALTWNTSGNVGIGTTAPTEKLTVNGNISDTGNITTTGTVTSAIDSTQQLAVNCGSGTELTTFNQSGTPGIQSVASQWFYLFSGAGADLKIKTTTTETDNEFVCAGLYNSGNDTVAGTLTVGGAVKISTLSPSGIVTNDNSGNLSTAKLSSLLSAGGVKSFGGSVLTNTATAGGSDNINCDIYNTFVWSPTPPGTYGQNLTVIISGSPPEGALLFVHGYQNMTQGFLIGGRSFPAGPGGGVHGILIRNNASWHILSLSQE